MPINSKSTWISIIIRCHNCARDLDTCLIQIQKQQVPTQFQVEVVVVDNESTDDTASIAKSHGTKLVPISIEKFTWGRAINKGIEASRGQYIIILSADAHPADNCWLKELLAPFSSEAVVAVYGRQLPRKDAPIDERSRLIKKFSATSITIGPTQGKVLPTGGYGISNACAAIRRSAWELQPYDEVIEGGEEGVWTYAMVEKGFSYAYQAKACVFHSHKDSIGRYVWRMLELFEKNMALNGSSVNIKSTLKAAASLVKGRLKNCLYVEGPHIQRLVAFLRLPCEVILFIFITAVTRGRYSRWKLRRLFWR